MMTSAAAACLCTPWLLLLCSSSMICISDRLHHALWNVLQMHTCKVNEV